MKIINDLTTKEKHSSFLIVGPTASGKSAYALALAQTINGIIINADSLQIYRGLSVLTAQPSSEDCEQAPHRLYGFLSPEEAYSAQRWRKDALAAIAEIHAQGHPAILVGGSGFYIKALLEGLSPLPEISADTRARVAHYLEENGLLALRTLLKIHDSEIADRLHPNDLQRQCRALEVFWETGKPLTFWQSLKSDPAPYDFYKIGIFPERTSHEAIMHDRVIKMWESGALEEVRVLLDHDLSPHAPARKAIGFEEIAAYLTGTISQEIAQTQMILKTRQYAKRQRTWFRHQIKFDCIEGKSLVL